MTDVRFDDLDALGALVSDTFGPWGEPIVVTQEMIQQFADLTGDQQWIHTDMERCRRESSIGTTIAHGFLLVSLLPALVRGAPGAGVVGQRTVINYGIDQLRFVSPVPSGSRIQARRRIAHVRKKGPNGTQLTFETEVRLVDADRPPSSAAPSCSSRGEAITRRREGTKTREDVFGGDEAWRPTTTPPPQSRLRRSSRDQARGASLSDQACAAPKKSILRAIFVPSCLRVKYQPAGQVTPWARW